MYMTTKYIYCSLIGLQNNNDAVSVETEEGIVPLQFEQIVAEWVRRRTWDSR